MVQLEGPPEGRQQPGIQSWAPAPAEPGACNGVLLSTAMLLWSPRPGGRTGSAQSDGNSQHPVTLELEERMRSNRGNSGNTCPRAYQTVVDKWGHKS